MSDEEKKAIENIKSELNINEFLPKLAFNCDDIELVLNLIEKQQKEIDELKEENKPQPDCAEPVERTEEMVNMKWVNYNYISKDKIKAKIEKIKKYKDLAKDSIEERIVIADSDSLNYGRKEAHEKDIDVFQSLLKKE